MELTRRSLRVVRWSQGTISVQPLVQQLSGFDAHMAGLDPRSPTALERNPWLAEFWEETFHCRLSDDRPDGDRRPECDPAIQLSRHGSYRLVMPGRWTLASKLTHKRRSLSFLVRAKTSNVSPSQRRSQKSANCKRVHGAEGMGAFSHERGALDFHRAI